jgi:hypothetical protein
MLAPKIAVMTKIRRTTTGSMFKYSASPPQTPEIILLFRERYNFLGSDAIF